MTRDTWHVGGSEPSLKISAPWLFWFGNEGLMKKDILTNHDLLKYQLTTKLFLEQPRLPQVCKKVPTCLRINKTLPKVLAMLFDTVLENILCGQKHFFLLLCISLSKYCNHKFICIHIYIKEVYNIRWNVKKTQKIRRK